MELFPYVPFMPLWLVLAIYVVLLLGLGLLYLLSLALDAIDRNSQKLRRTNGRK